MASPSHVPVLLDRVVALLAPALERTRAPCSSTRPSGSAATARRCSAGARAGPRGRHRPRPAGAASWPASGSRRTATGSPSCTRCTTRSPRCSPTSGSPPSTACCSTSASPRCSSTSRERGFAYARGRAAGHADGRRPTGPTAADVLNTYPRAELARILREYGEERFARRIAARGRPRARHASRSPTRPGWSSCSATRSRRRPGVPADTRPSAPSRRCGSRSTTSSACCAGPSRPRSTRSASAAGVVVESYHSLEDRLVKQAFAAATRLDVPPDLPFVPADHEPALRLVTRGAEQADADEIAKQPARRLGPAARRRTRPHRSGDTAAGARLIDEQHRTGAPGPGPAARRGRRRAGPAHRRPAAAPSPDAARVPFAARWCSMVAGRRRRRAAAVQHLDAAGVVRGDRAAGPGRRPRRPAADAADGARPAARPAAGRAQGPADGHGAADQPGRSRPRDRQGARQPDPGDRARRRCGCSHRRRAKPAELEPAGPRDRRPGRRPPHQHGDRRRSTTGRTGGRPRGQARHATSGTH